MAPRAHLERYGKLARRALADLFDQRTGFGRLALVHSFQAAGTTLITISLAGSLFFSISPDAAKSRVLLYLLLTIAPFALVGPALSPLLDRGRQARRTSVAVANGGSAFLCFLMAGDIHDLLLFPEAFGILVLGKLYLVGRASLVPATIREGDDLASANARLAVLASLAGFAAFPFGLILLKVGAAWVLRFGVLVFLGGTVASLRLPRPQGEGFAARAPAGPAGSVPDGPMGAGPAAPRSTGGPEATALLPVVSPARQAPPRRSEVAAARRVLGLPLYPGSVRAALTAMSVARGTVGFVEFFLAFELRRAHAGSWWFGLVLVASGAGSLLGALVVPRLRQFLSERQIIVCSLLAIAGGALAATLLGGLWAQALLTFVVGAGPTAAKPALDSLVQRNVAPALLGRAFGRLETRLQLTWVVAALLGVLIPFPLRIGDLVVTLVCLLAGLSYLTAHAARRRRAAVRLQPR